MTAKAKTFGGKWAGEIPDFARKTEVGYDDPAVWLAYAEADFAGSPYRKFHPAALARVWKVPFRMDLLPWTGTAMVLAPLA